MLPLDVDCATLSIVTESCTCGAPLPPDARFCHKCGRPLYAEPVAIPEPQTVAVVEPTPPKPVDAPAGIGLRNPVAVRIALLAGAITSLLTSFPLPTFIALLWLIVVIVGGGFWSVYLYQRRTGSYLSVRSGAHLGWLTGIFSFLIMMVMFTAGVLLIAGGGGLQTFFRDRIASQATSEVAEQVNTILASPLGIAALLFGSLLMFFFLLTVLATVGGALGAKILEKE